jgi:hypothetical protein
MKKIKKLLLVLTLIFVSNLTAIEVNAQCPMCKMSAENNLKDGGTAGKGLNKGIFMMLAMPYVLVGTIGVLWYRNRKKEEEI